MKYFLKQVAKSIKVHLADRPDEHCIVFPNRRSSLFFSKYLSAEFNRPVWSPSVVTINELFSSGSNAVVPDQVTLLFELYDAYRKTGGKETIDEFWFWGEMILADFDEVDKYMVDPSSIFSNISDLREIDSKFGRQDDDIIAIIKKFWINFEAEKITDEKSGFLKMWKILEPLYTSFKEKLDKKGMAYEGMLMKNRLKDISEGGWKPWDEFSCYWFIGFNALNSCEISLMETLKKFNKARFYWDYNEESQTKLTGSLSNDFRDHPSGYFIRRNIEKFGMEDYHQPDPVEAEKSTVPEIKIYSVPSDTAQTKLIYNLVEELGETGSDPDNTAIILADEKLMLPVIGSLPGFVKDLNITMGYPLHLTPIYSLITGLMNLQQNLRVEGHYHFFGYRDVLRILNHQYIFRLNENDIRSITEKCSSENLYRLEESELAVNEVLCSIFRRVTDSGDLIIYLSSVADMLIKEIEDNNIEGDNSSPGNEDKGLLLRHEYLVRFIQALNQLKSQFEAYSDLPGLTVTARLVERIMHGLVIPFAGEPLRGLQVMGILESRALNFRNLIILSMNEGIMPKTVHANSFIPYNLREAFGLPTTRHQDSIFSYYFFRLLQNCEKVTLVYNSNSEGMKSGEMSRYIYELKYGPSEVSFFDTSLKILPHSRLKGIVESKSRISEILNEKYISPSGKSFISPSALNTWLNCRMKFYYQYVCNLREPDEIRMQADAQSLGSVLHYAMQQLHEPFRNKILNRETIESFQQDSGFLDALVKKAFKTKFLKGKFATITGSNLVAVQIIKEMINRILKYDSDLGDISITGLEECVNTNVEIPVNGVMSKIRIGGFIDRIDQINNITRIIDYKTGRDKNEVKNIEELFQPEISGRNSAAFQTLVYCEIAARLKLGEEIRPSLYALRLMNNQDFTDRFKIKDGQYKGLINSYSDIRQDVSSGINSVLESIFNMTLPVEMTADTKACSYCPFSILCGRDNIKY